MQKTDSKQKAMTAQRKVGTSTTLSRKLVRNRSMGVDSMTKVTRSARIQHFGGSAIQSPALRATPEQMFVQNTQNVNKTVPMVGTMPAEEVIPVEETASISEVTTAPVHPIQAYVNRQMKVKKQMTTSATKATTAKQIKDQAIKKALADTIAQEETKPVVKQKKLGKIHFGFGRVVLALSCAAVAVLIIAYFVNVNMPDISLKVAAMQTGINATYPSYVPRDYSISSITSEDKKITLKFRNNSTGDAYNIIEETSSWDSNALLNNYVAPTYGDKYSIIREQGLTLYVTDNDAAWVNGGVVYKLNTTSGELTSKQIRSIAASL